MDTSEQEARFGLAVKLYEMGRLTSGRASQLAGVSRVAFLLHCRRYGAAGVEWDQRVKSASQLWADRISVPSG